MSSSAVTQLNYINLNPQYNHVLINFLKIIINHLRSCLEGLDEVPDTHSLPGTLRQDYLYCLVQTSFQSLVSRTRHHHQSHSHHFAKLGRLKKQ